METPFYFTAAILFTLLTIVLTGAILYALRYALNKAGWSQHKKKNVFRFTMLALLGWLALLVILASQNFFSDFSTMPPRFVLAIVPPWVVISVLVNIKGFKYLLSLVPAAWLVYPQSFRVIVEIGLWMVFVAGIAPEQMTFEGRNYDILTGLTAPFAAYFFFRKVLKVRWGVLWNIFGLGLLMNIVIIAILSTPTPFRVFWNEPANTFVTTVPFIWLPGFLVPVALALHVFSLVQLRGRQKEGIQPSANKPLQKVA